MGKFIESGRLPTIADVQIGRGGLVIRALHAAKRGGLAWGSAELAEGPGAPCAHHPMLHGLMKDISSSLNDPDMIGIASPHSTKGLNRAGGLR